MDSRDDEEQGQALQVKLMSHTGLEKLPELLGTAKRTPLWLRTEVTKILLSLPNSSIFTLFHCTEEACFESTAVDLKLYKHSSYFETSEEFLLSPNI